ncbi:ABC transporter substrate-binding protein [Carnobacterium divergens]|uniref:Lipoprotein binding vitamin B12 n=2 Tax=Carnobacterium divergens TaxID=2748 RepID=A0A0R2HYM2_CARDV|nr:ABC transporter substrate-binding protein [Carnobacterium divergens]KRN57518.1 lipoprotein binding vitamin B12 [Carnobacterium divergens DSM 20623]MDO0875722.1 ABC transporter substrate-binding protein [Carnobacterium divergens]MDT1958695.1 ABC transporter substrate-binding protein [Carnobacterium divergens]MDT1974575.1 ABC transporter substrate-binding protein [Carnobacterium divergens]SUX23839.1 corrinoid ABC transporter substrate-binding protein [Carnobacterium divergens]
MKKTFLIGSIFALSLFVSACGAKENNAQSGTQSNGSYPVKINNYTKAEGSTKWEPKEETFQEAPHKIMANTKPAAELLLHLGLEDKIVGVGADFGEPDKAVEKAYSKLPILSKDYVGKEVTLGTNPDFVYGRAGLFDNNEWGVGTVDSLNDSGIRTYLLESSVTGGTFDSIYQDIDNLGKIFNVEDKAKSFAAEIKAKETTLTTSLKKINQNQTFAYIHTMDPTEIAVYPAHDESFFNDIFKLIKLDNVYKNEKGDVSIETLLKTDPDILIFPIWEDGADIAKIKAGFYANPKLTNMKAIKNKQVYGVDYNYLFGYGYQSLDGIEKLATEIYPDLFN